MRWTHGTGSETIPPYSISPDPSDSEVDVSGHSSSAYHRFSMGFRSGDCDGHGKTFILLSVNNFCVDFEVCFGSLSCWKVQPLPILSFLEGAVRFSFNICWYLMESMIPCILTICPGLLKQNSPTTSKIRHHTSHWVWGSLLYGYLSVYAKPTVDVCCQKALFWSHLTI